MKRLLRLHTLSWLLFWADLFCWSGTGFSLRGQWPDSVIVLAPFITSVVMLRFFRQLSWPRKVYFGLYVLSPISLLTLAGLLDMVERFSFGSRGSLIVELIFAPVLAPLASPVMLLLLAAGPRETLGQITGYEVRESGGVLGTRQLALVRQQLLWEREVGQVTIESGPGPVQAIVAQADSFQVRFLRPQGDTVLLFRPR